MTPVLSVTEGKTKVAIIISKVDFDFDEERTISNGNNKMFK